MVDLKGSISNLKERLARVKRKQQQRLEKLQALKDHYLAKAQSNDSEHSNEQTSQTEYQSAQEDDFVPDNATVDEDNSDVGFDCRTDRFDFLYFFHFTLNKLSFKVNWRSGGIEDKFIPKAKTYS